MQTNDDSDDDVVSVHAYNNNVIILNTYNRTSNSSKLCLLGNNDNNNIILRRFAGRIQIASDTSNLAAASSTEGILCLFRITTTTTDMVNEEIHTISKLPLTLDNVIKDGALFILKQQGKKNTVEEFGREVVVEWRSYIDDDDIKEFHVVAKQKKHIIVLYSNGSCYLIMGQGVQKKICNSNNIAWHSLSSPYNDDSIIMLVDVAGNVYYCEYRKGKVWPFSGLPFPAVGKVIPLQQSGFDCFFSSGGTLLGMMPHVSLSDSKNNTSIMYESNIGDCCIAECTASRLIMVRRDTKEVIIKDLDMDRFSGVVDELIQSKLFDTALNLVRRQKSCSELEIKVAHSQIYEGKDYENGMLNLSIACGDDTLKMLHVFDFLLPGEAKEDVTKYEQLCHALLPYLWSHRSRILSSSSSDTAMIDTAILNCLLIMSDGTCSILQFLQRRDNQVDYESSRVALQKRGLYSELLQLYSIQGHHSTAMELIKKLSLEPEKLIPTPAGTAAELKGRPGVWAAVRYLSSIVNPEISLVKYHSRWMMNVDLDATVTMFQHLYPSIPTKVAVSILSQDASAQYLEEILKIKEIDLGENATSVWEDRQALAELYLHMLAQDTYLEKLAHVLDNYSHTLDLNKLLRLLSDKGVHLDAMVLVLEKLEQHEKALEILVVDLEDPAKAERYCRRVGGVKVFIDLLNVALKSQQSILPRVLQILSRNISPDLVLQTLVCVPDMVRC